MAQALDFCLRCNSLRCRATLTEQAVVTTCSHIFCLRCADDLGLSHPTGTDRRCPACQTSLANPDDAVSTTLNPTEDYKTSVLSGLDPNTVMECAGRALAFWTYQTTQEIFYQEYLGKSLTDKYGALNKQMDKIIHDANSEISTLQNKISDLQANQEQLQKKNQELVEIYREKCKKHAQITNLYNLLKTRAMRSHIQTAASDSVANTLEALGTPGLDISAGVDHDSHRPVTAAMISTPKDGRHGQNSSHNDIEQLHRHQRSGSGHKRRHDSGAMPPPSALPLSFRNANIPTATPQHRTRLPQPQNFSVARGSGNVPPNCQGLFRSSKPFPDTQRAGGTATELPMNRSSNSNSNTYGFSAGVEIGRPTEFAFSTSDSRPGTSSVPH